MRLTPLLLTGSLLAPTGAPAQTGLPDGVADAENPAGALATWMLSRPCRPEEASPVALHPNLSNRFVTDVTGSVFLWPDEPPTEGQAINLVVLGPELGLRFVSAARSSETIDPDFVRLIGEVVEHDPGKVREEKCSSKLFRLSDFSAPEGVIRLQVIAGALPAVQTGEVRFAVRRAYRGAISFGPFLSWLNDRDYRGVAAGRDTAQVDSVLTVSRRGSRDFFALTLTYYLGSPVTSDSGLNWGLFMALPLGDALGEAVVGFSTGLGGGRFLLHVGAHFAKKTVLVHPGEDTVGARINGAEVVTDEMLSIGGALGLTLDAEIAARAFGKVMEKVLP